MMDPENVKNTIEQEIQDSEVQVFDMTGGGDHFRVVVISEEFEDLPMVKQHQKVYGCFDGAFEGGEQADIHAMGLKTFTPEEWEEFRQEQAG
ncbi:MAG: BolA family protein [bacterium]